MCQSEVGGSLTCVLTALKMLLHNHTSSPASDYVQHKNGGTEPHFTDTVDKLKFLGIGDLLPGQRNRPGDSTPPGCSLSATCLICGILFSLMVAVVWCLLYQENKPLLMHKGLLSVSTLGSPCLVCQKPKCLTVGSG